MKDIAAIKRLETVYDQLLPLMDERMRRQWAAAEAQAYGWGGIQAVSSAIGMSATTIRRGLGELSEREGNPGLTLTKRIRRAGGGARSKPNLILG